MTDRNTTRRTSTTGRDLRFAGAIASGLVAGVLGVGAIAVPLVGWNDWPKALSTSSGEPIEISTATDRSAPRRDSDASGTGRNAPRVTVTGPSGALAPLPAVSGTSGTTDGATAGAPSGAQAGGDRATVRRSRSGSSGSGGASDSFSSNQDFDKLADSDGDTIPDAVENEQGLNAAVNDAYADSDGDGVPNGV